ncbi:glycoside hydrolase family 15 protein [Xanthomonas oryzae]|uniref:glycoside hydrolase family 15 protein n=1 Tax=Xanthomonas oryzae TaxID=347 RepID=UPI003CCFEAD7
MPEHLGGTRNWDYRYCWLRDSVFTLIALLQAGYRDEAAAFRDWVHRTIAGSPDQLQALYGIAGEPAMVRWTQSRNAAASSRYPACSNAIRVNTESRSQQ